MFRCEINVFALSVYNPIELTRFSIDAELSTHDASLIQGSNRTAPFRCDLYAEIEYIV